MKYKFALSSTILIFLFMVSILKFGCGGDDVTGPEDGHGVVEVVIEPPVAEIDTGNNQEFEAFLKDAQGNIVDPAELDGFDIDWEWWSTDTNVFTVEQDGSTGIGAAESSGEAFCIIEVTITEGNSNFNGRDTSIVFVF